MLDAPASSLRFSRLLLTGAAGGLGQQLRPRLKRYCDTLRLSDIVPLVPQRAAPGEEIMICALEDAGAVRQLLEGVDAVIHMGGVSTEQAWAPILAANVAGVVNLYEAARLHKARRVVFASSNHVMGFYRQDEVIDARSLPRPDGFYGLSKAFGEDVAQLYWDRWGIETVSVRIGSCFPEPRDRRMLATWLSYDDLERLVVAALTAPVVGHSIIYGTSDNRSSWYDNRLARHVGYRPHDSSDPYCAQIEASQPELDRQDPAVVRQGGSFVKASPHG
jgi:uronate dehydrogenase